MYLVQHDIFTFSLFSHMKKHIEERHVNKHIEERHTKKHIEERHMKKHIEERHMKKHIEERHMKKHIEERHMNKHILLNLYFMINTHIYIYTLQGLGYPQGIITIFAYIPGAFWTIQHLTHTLAFNDH